MWGLGAYKTGSTHDPQSALYWFKIAHIGVIIRQIDGAPTYELAVFRSLGESLRHWLDLTAATL